MSFRSSDSDKTPTTTEIVVRYYQTKSSTINATTDDRTYQIRSGLFDKLAAHFPDELTHPRGSLIDLIPYSASLSNENSLATQ